MAAKSLDKILCGAALLVLLSSFAWTFNQGSKPGGANGSPRASGESALYVPASLNEFQVTTQLWAPPSAQSGGANWVYDVFTPPEIYYDLVSKRFTVTPPNATVTVDVKPTEAPFGVDLVHVKEDVFRLQLVGYTGKEGNFKGTFENTVSGKTVLGQAGKKIADLELTIVSFEVKQIRTKQPTSNTVIIETEAFAQVADDKTGEIFNLTNKNRLTKGPPIAYLKVDGSSAPVAFKAGATFKVGDATFTVTAVSFEPNEVVVTKESPSIKSVTKTLTGVAPAPAVPPATPVAPATPAAKVPATASPFAL